MPSDPENLHFCWICGEQVSLREAKIDEQGRAVHEQCYFARLNADKKTT